MDRQRLAVHRIRSAPRMIVHHCSGCGESLAGAHPLRRWCAPCRSIRHAEKVVARQTERYRTDPEYRAAKLAKSRAMR